MAVSFRADSACRLVSYFKALIELVYQKLRLPNQREVPDTENAAEPAVTASQRTLAWKHVGYPGSCKLMGSSDELLALRFFKNVNVRVLLRLQNDIVRLERALKQQDDYTKGLPIDQGSCASLRLDAGSPREETLTQLQHRLKDYSKLTCGSFAVYMQADMITRWTAEYLPPAVRSTRCPCCSAAESQAMATTIPQRHRDP